MLNKKLVATVLTAAMVFGSCFTVMADEASSATGTGSSYDHVDTDIITVTYPTTAAVATAFNFVVDPERLVNQAGGKLGDNTSVTANDDGVYFVGSNTASSNAIDIEGKNSVAVDLSVAVSVTASANSIALVADEAALEAATDPALLLSVKVGTDEKVITSAGVTTAKDSIEGVSSNFVMKPKDGQFEYVVKDGATGWKKAAVQLIGKTNEAEVPEGAGAMSAPTVELTWTVAKHVDAYVSATTIGTAGVTLSLPESVSISSVVLNKAADTNVTLEAGNTYTVTGTTLKVKDAIIGAYPGKTITITYSDNHVDVLTIS